MLGLGPKSPQDVDAPQPPETSRSAGQLPETSKSVRQPPEMSKSAGLPRTPSKSARQVNTENKAPEPPGGKQQQQPRSAGQPKSKEPEVPLPVYRVNNAGLYKATFYSNIGSFFFGIAMGWTGGAEESIMGHSSYEFRPSKLQWHYVCLLLTLGAMVWCLPTGFLLRFCGCKRMILAQLLPNTVGWGLTAWGQSIQMLYIGRFLLGMCGGAHCVAVPIYSAEISTIKKRGPMGVCFYGACIIGVFYSILMGYFLEIKVVNLINLVLILLGLLQFLMPESPAYYVQREDITGAEDSLRWLRGKEHNVGKEMARLTREPTESEHDMRQHPHQGFQYIEVRRSLIRALALAVLHKLCGSYAFIFYSYELLGCLLVPSWLILTLAGAAMVGFLMCLLLVQHVSRKQLIVVCTAFMFFATCITGIGLKLFLRHGGEFLRWVIFASMEGFVLAYTAGLGSLTWLITVELFVPPMRPLGCSIAATVSWLSASIAILWYTAVNSVCQPYFFLIFAIAAVVCLLFVLAYIPETKAVSAKRISNIMASKHNNASSDESD